MIVLDEPTTGVDPVSRREFWKLLSQFLESGITILMSTPYLDEAERCHRIALLHEGRVLALDEPGRLRQSLPGTLVRSGGGSPRDAVARLTARGIDGLRTFVFGDRLHAWLDTSDAARRGSSWTLAVKRRRCRPGDGAGDRALARGRLHRSTDRTWTLMTRASLMAVVWLCVGASPLLAQPAVERLTVSDAVSRAFEASHKLAEARARQEGAQATVQVRAGGRQADRERDRAATRAPITSTSSASPHRMAG